MMRHVRRRRAALLILLGCGAACQSRDGQHADSAAGASDGATRAVAAPSGDTVRSDTSAVLARSGGRDSLVEYYTAAMLGHVGDSLARGSSTGHMLRGHPTYQYLQIRRSRNGVPEVHDRWIDVTMVQAGRATLLSGGRVAGSHLEAPGEHRGGTISGGASRPVAAGDLMVIPAGVPHQYLIAAGDSLRYVTVKVLRPAGGN